MNLFVQGRILTTELNMLQKSFSEANLPVEVIVTFKKSALSGGIGGMVIVISRGKAAQQRLVYAWWQDALTKAGYKTGLG